MLPKLLVVDDEPQICSLVSELLSQDFETTTAKNGREALEKLKEGLPDLLLLDLMMPEMDGFETCRAIRENPDTRHLPILMLTAASKSPERIQAYELGVDDFIAKPFHFTELRARALSKLRRSREYPLPPLRVLLSGDVEIDVCKRSVRIAGTLIPLAGTEFDLLTVLVESEGRVVSRAAILEAVWKGAVSNDRLIDAHMVSLRKALGNSNRWIRTVYGTGYKFCPKQ